MDNDLIKTADYIRQKTPIWCYTLNYRTRTVKERKGCIVYFCNGRTRAMFRDDDEPRKWATWTLNGLSPYEATVRGATVWYAEPSFEKAVEAFRMSGKKLAMDYGMKSCKSYDRYLHMEVANGN